LLLPCPHGATTNGRPCNGTVGSWLGIRLASRWIGRILDRIHTRVYLLLLTEVLVVMVVMRDFK